jgi:voltage-gated potassium channel
MLGVLMFFIEGKNNGFTSVPESIYWAIITLTTMGYGDIVPQTGIGGAVASVLMISGFSIIIVPVAIVIIEVYNSLYKAVSGKEH